MSDPDQHTAAIREALEAAYERVDVLEHGMWGLTPALVALDALSRLLRKQEEALRFYADPTTWDDEGRAWIAVGHPENVEADEDRGRVARAALAATGREGTP